MCEKATDNLRTYGSNVATRWDGDWPHNIASSSRSFTLELPLHSEAASCPGNDNQGMSITKSQACAAEYSCGNLSVYKWHYLEGGNISRTHGQTSPFSSPRATDVAYYSTYYIATVSVPGKLISKILVFHWIFGSWFAVGTPLRNQALVAGHV